MVDTIRFRVKLNDGQFKSRFISKSTEYRKVDNATGLVFFNFFSSDVSIPSHSSGINFFYNASALDSVLYFELSLPKFEFGHNIFLLYPEELPEVVNDLYLFLDSQIPEFPKPSEWEITRLDVCYAWKYETQHDAENVLNYIKAFDFPRKKKTVYQSSVMCKGTDYTVKFYLKRPEYYQHDFKKYLKMGLQSEAYNYLQWSDGVLRFEVTCRKAFLESFFRIKTVKLTDIFDKENIDNLLFFVFRKYIKGYNSDIVNSYDVFQKLKSNYSHRKALILWQFWKVYHSISEVDKPILAEYDRTTIYRYKRDLERAGIGIKFVKNLNFDLKIPSEYSTRHRPSHASGGRPSSNTEEVLRG